jgi:hypothetical protein
MDQVAKNQKTEYKGYQIDFKESGAVVYFNNEFIKAFASDDPNTTEITGLSKAKKFIDLK